MVRAEGLEQEDTGRTFALHEDPLGFDSWLPTWSPKFEGVILHAKLGETLEHCQVQLPENKTRA